MLEVLEDRLVLSGSPPAVLISGPAQVGESPYGPYTLNLTAVDPEGDPVTQWTIDWGDGLVETLPGNPSSATHDYASGPANVSITASAVVGGESFPAQIAAPTTLLGTWVQAGAGQPTVATMTFGRDITNDGVDDLYVTGIDSNSVGVYDGQTRQYVRTLISAADGLGRPIGIAFGPDGNLYVSGESSSNVLRYDFANSTVSTFVPAAAGRSSFRALAFGPDGHLYVALETPSPDPDRIIEKILRFDGTTGQPLGVFVDFGFLNSAQPYHMEFRPDGYLYVTDSGVVRYDAATGAFHDVFIPTSDVLRTPLGFAFAPNSDLYITNYYSGTPLVLHYDGATGALQETITAGLNWPGPLDVAFGPDTNGDGRPEMYVTNEGTNSILHYSGPLTATTDTTLEVTVLDIQTKFYVPDDGASNLTYEYAIGGTSVESYALNSGNTAPRGAASNAAGDKVWVVDANKKVYVYNAAGILFGSWTLGGLSGSAQVEDIATNGTDIWIVDAKQDKVFRYAGAAARLSGSQNAASSFSLNSGNKNPKGIVTDGTSLWVVDDAGTDKVFKYTLTGTLLGSWTITAGGGNPTGITLDPSAPAHLWIVDSGTDRVYQYDNAAGRTSGSQSASVSFALAAGNANPQGIADPPGIASLIRPGHKVRRRGNHSDRSLRRDPADELGGRNHDLGRRAADRGGKV